MAPPVVNLGGVTLDLGGGLYNVSAPLVFPPLVGNFKIIQGTLRASGDFPPGRFLIEVGTFNCTSVGHQGTCNQAVTVANMYLDGSHKAAGGVNIRTTMGATIGPSVFVVGFHDTGIRVDGGHETVIVESWVGDYFWTNFPPQGYSSIGIELNGPDNVLTNVVVFVHTKIGVIVGWSARGASTAQYAGCNMLEGVHVWNGGPTQVRPRAHSPRDGPAVAQSTLFPSICLFECPNFLIAGNRISSRVP
eukprot:m.112226 g.112226  ORF g.112226 m.112226 type:complete len:247 (-) comp12963_c0_seq5:721-1461(-)